MENMSQFIETKEQILKKDWSESFIKGMENRIVTSHYKYGWMEKTYPELASAIESLKARLRLYEKTHNTEYLMDIANFAMIEFMYPTFEDANFVPTDSDGSPGLQDSRGRDTQSFAEMVAEIERESRHEFI